MSVPQRTAPARTREDIREDEVTRRNELVLVHLPLARRLACRFTRRGVPRDDLIQVASLGLVMAVERFDPSRGTPFEVYATPTILGEIKRHFRDRLWDLRVPRRTKELHLAVGAVIGRLTQELGRTATIGELAAATGASEEEVLLAIEAGAAFNARSLQSGCDSFGLDDLEQATAETDRWTTACVDRLMLAEALAEVPGRERLILQLHYWQHYSQDQIAERLGISQMHVSRLLRRGLSRLEALLTDIA